MTYPLDSTSSPSNSGIRIRTALLQNLTTQTALVQQLFSQWTTPSSSSVDPVGVIYGLLHAQMVEMAGLVKELWEHQEAYARLMEQKREVLGLERQVREVLRTLEKGRGELEQMIDEGKDVRRAIERGQTDPIGVGPLLAHAQRLARHSSAPVSSLIQPTDKAQYVPWPDQNIMRQGLLFALQGSMSGVGDTGTIGDGVSTPLPEAGLMAETQVKPAAPETRTEAVPEEHGRRYDPTAVYDLDLNSDSDDD